MSYNTIPKGASRVETSYYVTRGGEVWSFISGKFLKIQDNGIGYKQVWLRMSSGGSRWFKIHRLVATAFIRNPKGLPEVGHKDNDKANNHVDNLYWCTHGQNIQDSIDSGVRRGWRGVVPPMAGRSHSEESKQKMSESKVGVNHPKFKGYYLYEGEMFESIAAVAEKLGTYPMKVHRMFRRG